MKVTMIACALTLLGVAACAPIPTQTRSYVHNTNDVGYSYSASGSCMLNGGASAGIRRFGDVEVVTQLYAKAEDSPKSQMGLSISVVQPLKSGAAPSVTINAARSILQEGGRQIAARLDAPAKQLDLFGTSRRNSAFVSFPASRGNSESLHVVFAPGAVKVGGRVLDMAPIRFTLKTSSEIQVFPFIPT